MNNLLNCPHNIPLDRRCPECVIGRRRSYSNRLRYYNRLTDYENRLLSLHDIINSYSFNNNRYLELQIRQKIISDINFILNIINRFNINFEGRNILNFYNNLLTLFIRFNPASEINNMITNITPDTSSDNNITNLISRDIVNIKDLNKNSELIISEKLDDKCSICLEKYKEKEILRKLSCEHIFHYKCIDKWLENQYKCPICRNVLNNI